MRHRGILKLLSGLAILVSTFSFAASNEELYEVQKVNVAGNELFLNGMGAVKKHSTTYYIAALYVKNKSRIDTDIIFDEDAKRMTLTFALDRVSGRSFGREMAGSLKINNVPDELQAYRGDLRTFIGMFKGIYSKGDILTFDFIPKTGVIVRHNGEILGQIRNRGFDKILFKAWLGEKPYSASFKKGLIGANEDKYAIELLRQYVEVKKN
ncbi:chalcone isomerase family protein [Pleionea sediminis]|uniref:chalcone isomerase family protein n=1 Tax=Pleionea sediminis TaxID=2569479 RepID=UPI0011868FCD|nr:chalcone isomerase family protein [Pleionea sediminis]